MKFQPSVGSRQDAIRRFNQSRCNGAAGPSLKDGRNLGDGIADADLSPVRRHPSLLPFAARGVIEGVFLGGVVEPPHPVTPFEPPIGAVRLTLKYGFEARFIALLEEGAQAVHIR